MALVGGGGGGGGVICLLGGGGGGGHPPSAFCLPTTFLRTLECDCHDLPG